MTDVQPNGPAYGTLYPPDEGGPDIIQSVEGKPVKTEAELRDALKAAGKGCDRDPKDLQCPGWSVPD